MTPKSSTEKRAGFRNWLVLPALVLVIFAFDQFTKYLIRSNLAVQQVIAPIPALSHLFTLTYVTNTGAAFGLFPDRGLFFVVVAILVSLGIILYFHHIPDNEWLLKLSLAMQLGGALGNLVDRLRLGYVVDFVDFRAWPVFNFADTFIVVGVGLLVYRFLFHSDSFVPTEGAGPQPATHMHSSSDEFDYPSGDRDS